MDIHYDPENNTGILLNEKGIDLSQWKGSDQPKNFKIAYFILPIKHKPL